MEGKGGETCGGEGGHIQRSESPPYHRAMAPIAVVQFGFAITGAPTHLRPLISGMTSGTSGLYRNADELSITTVCFGPEGGWVEQRSKWKCGKCREGKGRE